MKFIALSFLAACGFRGGLATGDGDGGGGGDTPPPTADAGPDAHVVSTADAQTCFGTGLVRLCLASPPTGAVTLSGTLDTGVDASCTSIVTTSQPALCVIAGATISVPGSFIAIGSRPLVVVAADSITVAGTIDVSSTAQPRRSGAGANTGACNAGGAGRHDRGGGGGGAGGSLAAAGGNGGTGDLNQNFDPPGTAPGGSAGATVGTPTTLRGGCPGAAGGAGDTTNVTGGGGLGGDGGGGVYLIAANAIHVTGGVFASGAGGGANPGGAGFEQGAGGGGSGGMIGLDAPAIAIDGIIAANGGAGAGGGGNVGGTVGGDGTTTAFSTRASHGVGDVTGSAGDGGDGSALGNVAGSAGASADAGGGGGGGGIGVVWVDGVVTGGTMVSPTATTH